MAETEYPEINCVYVDTNLNTHLVVLVHNRETISDFKEKLCKEHHQCFPKLGEIGVSAVKVQRQNSLGLLLDYHLSDSMYLSMAFEGLSHSCWFVSVDVAVKCSEHELLEKNKQIATGSLVLDGCSKNLTLEQDLGTQVAEKTSKKRKLRSLDGGKSRKKASVDPNQSASRFDVDESHELCGDVQVESSPTEKLDDTATGKEIEMGEKSVEDLGGDKTENNDPVSHPANLLDTDSGLMPSGPDTEKKRRNKRSKEDINQSSATAVVSEINGLPANVDRVDATPESLPISRGNHLAEASQKENDVAENSVDDLARNKTETDNIATHTAVHLDSNNLDKEAKKGKKKSSNEDTNQSDATIITSRDIVNHKNEVTANVDPVDATPESLPISRGENLDNDFAEASQKENESLEKPVEDVGRDNIQNDNIASRPENHLDTNSGLTTRPDTEKKQRRKKRSKDDTNQSSASAAITTSRDIVNEINGVPANVEPVDATPSSLPISTGEILDNRFAEASQKENEIIEKSVKDAGKDYIETDNKASCPENHLDTYSGLTTRPEPDTEKTKKRKKRSKDDINQSSASAGITTSKDIVNEINGVPANVDPVDDTPASLPISRGTLAESGQNGNEMVEKIDDDVGSGKTIPSAADNSQTNNVEVDDADGAKSMNPSKKRKSKKARTLTEEDTPVASGTQNVERIKVVDGEGTDNVIRNILDSLQEQNETEGNLDKTAKKSSKKSKKKHSSKVADSHVLSVEVNNAALEETPLVDNPKDNDALFTSAKKDTESDASLLKKSSEIADNAEDNSLSKKTPIEKVDMADNFGCSQNQEKQDQVAGGAKSKKVKKARDLQPSGSIAGSLNSVKPKEKKSRGQQPASSGASHLQSMVKNGRSGSVKTTVSSKKHDAKKSSKPVVVNKRKTNFFENAEKCNSSEDEYIKTTDVSTKTPSDYSSDNDSDVTSMSRKQGNNLAGGANKFSGSLQDLLRRSSSYKKALIRAQSQPDIDDESPVDCVPDSQGV